MITFRNQKSKFYLNNIIFYKHFRMLFIIYLIEKLHIKFDIRNIYKILDLRRSARHCEITS